MSKHDPPTIEMGSDKYAMKLIFIGASLLIYLSIAFFSPCFSASDDSYYNSQKVIVNSTVLLAKLEGGGDLIYGPDTIIVGDLKIQKNKLISSKIKISSQISGNVNFPASIFLKDVDFSDSQFLDDASFTDCTFKRSCIFKLSDFKKLTKFKGSIFSGYALFNDATFEDSAIFEDTQFLGGTFFWGSKFLKYTTYGNSSFEGYSSFQKARFDGLSDFSLARFWENGQFQNAIFNQRALFRRTNFSKEASFKDSQFSGDAEFCGSTFQSLARFNSSSFEKSANFGVNPSLGLQGAMFNGDLIFNGAKIQNLYLQGAVLSPGSRIFLESSDFAKMITDWNDLKDHLGFSSPAYSGQVYLALKRIFKDQEQFPDADDCYYQYRLASMNGPLDYISCLSCGFGVRPHYVLWSSLGLILLFGIAFWWGGIQKKSQRRALFSNRINKKRRFFREFEDALLYSLLIFTFQTRGGWSARGTYKALAVFEGIIGLVMFALFTVTLANIMIRY